MPVTVKAIDVGDLKFVTPEIMRRAAEYLRRLQAERLERGQGSNGRQMKRYSKAYAKVRAEAGREVDKRTLTFTGAMKAARTVKEVTKTTAELGWLDEEQAQKARGNEVRTPFLEPTKGERKKLAAFIKKEIVEHVNKLKRELAQRMLRSR